MADIETALAGQRTTVRKIPKHKKAPRSVKAAPPRTSLPRPKTTAAAGASELATGTSQVAEPNEDHPQPDMPPGGGGLLRSVSQTVRVDIHKLDELMNVVGKLAVLRGGLSDLTESARSDGHRRLGSQLGQLAHKFERSLRELQSGILEVRMVPLAQVFERLTRIVRKTGRDLNKDVRLVVTGAETEIDKLIVEELSDPLMHIIRNAIDHGIEDAEERQRIGKPTVGTIALNAFQKGNHVVIEAEDDGRGLNSDSLLDRAIQLGAIAEHEAKELSREDALNLVFLPGLSTREQASAVSGRGVGMDVVKTNIAKLGGSIELESEPVIGTKITLTLPLTRAIVTALLVQVADGMFAIPLTSISEVNALEEEHIRMIDTTEVLSRRGSSLELCRLRNLFQLPGDSEPQRQFVVEVMAGTRHLGLVVDTLQGQQDIIIRPLGRSLHSVRGFSGASELADERIALVLDPGALIEEASGSRERSGRVRLNG
jgi:two-component system chemotaxis sensor kinase CheA